jgi:hypothetical protein
MSAPTGNHSVILDPKCVIRKGFDNRHHAHALFALGGIPANSTERLWHRGSVPGTIGIGASVGLVLNSYI